MLETKRITLAAAQANHEGLEISKKFLNDRLKATDWERNKKRNLRGIEKYTEMAANEKDKTKKEKYEKIISDLEKENKFFRFDISGTFSGEEQIESTMIHEYGHIIADQYIGQISRQAANSAFGYEPGNELNAMCSKVAFALYKARTSGDIYNLSMYAEQDEYEFFAECFTMYEKGENLPDYIVEMIEGVLSYGTVQGM